MCASKDETVTGDQKPPESDDDLPLPLSLPLLLALSGSPLGMGLLPALLAGGGPQKAKRVKRSFLIEKYGEDAGRFRKTTGNVAAIDFGTTFCSLAYTTSNATGEEEVNTLKLNQYYTRVPTAILLKQEGDNSVQNFDADDPIIRSPIYEVESFGYEAQEKHTKLRSTERSKTLYFERFKMSLQQDQDVNRNMPIKSTNGTECYLVEVIAFILQYLKDQLSLHLQKSGSGLDIYSFDWVITVPAIWKSRGKRMMREAAYKAGLCSSDNSISRFIQVGGGVPRPEESNPDKLTLALEPEAAAIYCQTMTRDSLPEHCRVDSSVQSSRYLVIDIGGGTVDITAHRHNEEKGIEVIAEPIGNDCGGMKVNREFAKFLQEIVNDKADDPNKGFSRFLNTPDIGDNATRAALINSLLNKEFEQAKVHFGSKACGTDPNPSSLEDEDIGIELPFQFIDFYGIQTIQEGIAALKDDRIELDDTTLYLKFSFVADLFQPAVDGILSCVSSVLDRLKGDFDTIYLVGGFGGCKYIYEKISSLNKGSYSQFDIRIIVPKDHSLAVAQGAVKYRLKPDIISSRVMDATYGTDICPPFNPTIHDMKYFIGRDSRGIPRRRDVLLHYVDRGEVIASDEIVTAELSPLSDAATCMKIDLYSTLDKEVEYIKDEEEKSIPSIRKIGQIEVDMPNELSLPREKRLVEMTMDFSHTEIQVRAHYTVTGTQVKTTLDFLTDHSTTNNSSSAV